MSLKAFVGATFNNDRIILLGVYMIALLFFTDIAFANGDCPQNRNTKSAPNKSLKIESLIPANH